MSESGSDKRSRVAMMIKDSGLTWDLSRADVAALRHVLLLIDALTDEVAAYRGITCPQVIAEIERIMESNQ